MRLFNQPECQTCHSPLTVERIFIDCTCFGAACQRYLGVDNNDNDNVRQGLLTAELTIHQ